MKMIRLLGVIGLIGIMMTTPSFAFDRNAVVAGARAIVNANYTYNVVTNVINAGPVQVGSTNHSLAAYQSIAQITAQIQALKLQMKNFPLK